MTVVVRSLTERDTDQCVALWQEVGLTRPWNDPRLDIRRAMDTWPDLLLVAMDAESLVGTVMAGYDGHRGWLYYLATAPTRRGEGIARALVAEVERRLIALGCPKVQLMVRDDNTDVLAFYDTLGFDRTAVAVAGKRLIPDT